MAGNEYLGDFVYISVEPLKKLGYEIIKFDGTNLEDELLCYSFDDYDVIIGSVQATQAFIYYVH